LYKQIIATDQSFVVQEALNGIFPLFTAKAFLCVIIHDIVCIELNHFLNAHDNKVRFLELTEEFLKLRLGKLFGLSCVNIPRGNRHCKRKFMFQSEDWFIIFMVQNDVKTKLFDLVDEFLIVVALKRNQRA
jgi:hypothetical protein